MVTPPPHKKISVPEKRFTFDSLSKSENNQDIKWEKQFIRTLRWFSVNIRGKFQGAESAFSRLFLRFANLAKYDSSCKLFSTGSEIHSTAAPEARKMIELQTLRNGIPCSIFLYFCKFWKWSIFRLCRMESHVLRRSRTGKCLNMLPWRWRCRENGRFSTFYGFNETIGGSEANY